MTEDGEEDAGPGASSEVQPEVGDERRAFDDTESLLGRLLYCGVLPRYAFPTDVAPFYVFDRNRSTAFKLAFRFAPSQALPVALSQYAPGKEVWIANQRFRSGAIFSPMRVERQEAWRKRRLYYECATCHFAMTKSLVEGDKGEYISCPACKNDGTLGPARNWFRPPGFAHPVDIEPNVARDDMPPVSYATRAKLEAPTPDMEEGIWNVVTARMRGQYIRKELLVTNEGPKRDGYTYCTSCGRIEPTTPPSNKLMAPHLKPFPGDRDASCAGGYVATGVCLGTSFITDILLVNLRVDAPVRLTAGVLATEIALRTVSEAVARATCYVLELEEGEVQADFRPAVDEGSRARDEFEIYLYDTLPGGAGFARRAGERLAEVLECASALLAKCDCDASCYNCLRSFKNKFEHDRLDRRLGRDLLEYLLRDVRPVLDPGRERSAVTLLAADIERQGGSDLAVVTHANAAIPGFGTVEVPMAVRRGSELQAVVCVVHPLTPHLPSDVTLAEMRLVSDIPVLTPSELTIRRNLPSATQEVLDVVSE